MTATPTLPPIKLFMDSADLATLRQAYANPAISGFTTNPTLMRQAGVTDYVAFARAATAALPAKPISFEVFADSLAGMEDEAMVIHGWGGNTYVKIPISNTAGVSTAPLIRTLAARGVAVNVTAITTLDQARTAAEAVGGRARSILSIFAGRIADTGVDPEPVMQAAAELAAAYSGMELLWASPRQLFNLFQAARSGCHIITLSPELMAKLPLIGKNLDLVSLETIRMFFQDAQASRFSLA